MEISNKFNRANVGAVIHALRKNELHVGQSELSGEVGITQGTISKIENGTLELGISLYYELLKYFDLSSSEFSELVDSYIRETLNAQKLKIKENEKKEFISKQIATHANLLRAAR